MGLCWDEVKLPFPVGPGDELYLEMTVLEMRESKSRSDSGIRSKPKLFAQSEAWSGSGVYF